MDRAMKQNTWKKRFYTRGTLRGIRISRLAKTPYRDCRDPWFKKRVNHLKYLEGKEGSKDKNLKIQYKKKKLRDKQWQLLLSKS